jgi:hypothetical protein
MKVGGFLAGVVLVFSLQPVSGYLRTFEVRLFESFANTPSSPSARAPAQPELEVFGPSGGILGCVGLTPQWKTISKKIGPRRWERKLQRKTMIN